MPTTPTVPVSVWEQIPVIVIFAFLLAGMAWLMVKAFSKAVADINAHYAQIIDASNKQWQQYFDARSETTKIVNQNVIDKLESLTTIIHTLVTDFELHDAVEKKVFEDMLSNASAPKRNRNS